MPLNSQDIHKRKKRDSPSWWSALLCYCLVGYVSILVVFGQSTLLSFSASTTKTYAQGEESKKSSFPLDNPFQSETASNECKIPDGKELEDAEDDDYTKLFSLTVLSDLFNGNCFKCCFLQLNRSFQNRPTVSLIVLHHAWKSSLLDV